MQEYRVQIKSFLDTHKPYFMYEDQKYFIEDIASYHIHAGEYFLKYKPSGGHSNYNGNKLGHFQLTVNCDGILNAKDVKLYNSRFVDKTKDSSIYPEAWSEFVCDLKAIEALVSKEAIFTIDLSRGVINIEGYTTEKLKIRISYDIPGKKIKTHFPKFN